MIFAMLRRVSACADEIYTEEKTRKSAGLGSDWFQVVFTPIFVCIVHLLFMLIGIIIIGYIAVKVVNNFIPISSANYLLIGFIISFCYEIYFLPYNLSSKRNHHNTRSIGLLNFFLGWTVIGWVIALIWSQSNRVAPSENS